MLVLKLAQTQLPANADNTVIMGNLSDTQITLEDLADRRISLRIYGNNATGEGSRANAKQKNAPQTYYRPRRSNYHIFIYRGRGLLRTVEEPVSRY